MKTSPWDGQEIRKAMLAITIGPKRCVCVNGVRIDWPSRQMHTPCEARKQHSR